MRIIRGIPAILVIVVLALLPIGNGPGSLAAESAAGTVAGMGADQAMPECSSCLPSDTGEVMCAQACLGFPAIITEPSPAPSELMASVRLAPPADRLADEKAAPEPHPPKAIIPG